MENESNLPRDEWWLKKVTEAIYQNLANEHFGVSELSDALAISRYQLHRKLKSLKGKSVSQYIREIRLHEAREMLLSGVATAAEIAYRVGFNSPSYFNKCFHDYYGYPPGETRKKYSKRQEPALTSDDVQIINNERRSIRNYASRAVVIVVLFIALIGAAFVYDFLAPSEEPVSIAILPLENLTGSQEQVYFVSGMHDAIIGKLGEIRDLRVISRTSTLRYAQSQMLLKDIARQLDVNVIVEGSVFGNGDSVRLQLQMIEVFPKERHLWAREYHGKIASALALHSTVARDIAKEIRISLTADERSRLSQSRVVHPAAYKAYLKGMYYIHQATPGDVEKGLQHLHEAVRADPADPLAWAGLAIAYVTSGHSATGVEDPYKFGKAAAKRALAIDPNVAEAHLALGMIAMYNEWDWKAAEDGFKSALEINPNMAFAHTHYAWYKMLFGQTDQVLMHGKKAVEIDPFSPLYSSYLACEYWWLGQPRLALLEAERALRLAPDHALALWVQGAIFSSSGKHIQAIQVHRKAANTSPQFKWTLGHTYLAAARKEDAMKIAEELKVDPKPMDTWGLAEIYTASGDNNEAFRWLEECHRVRFSWIPWLAWNPNYKALHNDPRFHALLKEMRLPLSAKTIGNTAVTR